MLKFLVIAAAVALLVWLLLGRGVRQGKPPRSARSGQRDAPGGAESMVTCAQCGLHLPRSEALAARGLHYCSASHRDLPPPPA